VPKPLNVDWQIVQGLILQGFNCQQVAEKTGILPDTIRKRALRAGWLSQSDKVRQILIQSHQSKPILAVQVAKDHAKELAQASSKAQLAFSKEVEHQVGVLEKKPARRVSELASTPKREGRASVVSKLVHTAAKLYGWDQQTNAPTHVSLTKIDVHGQSTSVEPKPAGPTLDVPYD
jgi:hypothetical protein